MPVEIAGNAIEARPRSSASSRARRVARRHQCGRRIVPAVHRPEAMNDVRVGSPCPPVRTQSPGEIGASGRHSPARSGPAARWIAPATPPQGVARRSLRSPPPQTPAGRRCHRRPARPTPQPPSRYRSHEQLQRIRCTSVTTGPRRRRFESARPGAHRTIAIVGAVERRVTTFVRRPQPRDRFAGYKPERGRRRRQVAGDGVGREDVDERGQATQVPASHRHQGVAPL